MTSETTVPPREGTAPSPPSHWAIGWALGARDGRDRTIARPITAIPLGPPPPTTAGRALPVEILAQETEDGDQTGLPPDPHAAAILDHTVGRVAPTTPGTARS